MNCTISLHFKTVTGCHCSQPFPVKYVTKISILLERVVNFLIIGNSSTQGKWSQNVQTDELFKIITWQHY